MSQVPLNRFWQGKGRKRLGNGRGYLTDCWNGLTIIKSISGKTGRATADGRVIHHSTLRIGTASSRARIDASVVDAGGIGRTIRAQKTFRPAIGIRADHVWFASALSLSGNHVTDRIGSARVRIARIRRNRSQSRLFHGGTGDRGYRGQEFWLKMIRIRLEC